MAFNNQLYRTSCAILPRLCGLDKKVGERCLHPRMKMDLRLFEDDRRVRISVEALDDDRQDLRDPETDVRQVDAFLCVPSPNHYLIFLAVRGNWVNFKGL